MTAKRRAEARVRSIDEIRGRYGLAEERFQSLPEGDRDRRVGTVAGRQPRARARKFVASRQALMGTARLETPAVVRAYDEEPVSIPLHPMRWWPLVAGALIAPIIIALVSVRGSERDLPSTLSAAPAMVGSPRVASQRSSSGVATPGLAEAAARPLMARRNRRLAPPSAASQDTPPAALSADAVPSAEAAPSADASAEPIHQNDLPDFPELEEP